MNSAGFDTFLAWSKVEDKGYPLMLNQCPTLSHAIIQKTILLDAVFHSAFTVYVFKLFR
jgi:hypothetical protein